MSVDLGVGKLSFGGAAGLVLDMRLCLSLNPSIWIRSLSISAGQLD